MIRASHVIVAHRPGGESGHAWDNILYIGESDGANREHLLIMPNLLVAKSGAIRSVENLDSCLCMTSPKLSLASDSLSVTPPISLRMSSVSHVLRLFLKAIPCTVATASDWRPRESRYFGDSYRWKKKKRAMNMRKVMAPSVMAKKRQPLLSALWQQSWPGGAMWQDIRVGSHE